MPKLYACIISKADRDILTGVARQFSYGIEVMDDGVLFNVSGLERLIGSSDQIAQKIVDELGHSGIAGSVAVAEQVDTAVLLARQGTVDEGTAVHATDGFDQLLLRELPIEQDTINVFQDLGVRRIDDLLTIPRDELVNRYGKEFNDVIDIIEQRGQSLLTPNVKDSHVAWSYELDRAVEDFEQLIFLLNHGLDSLLARVAASGYSTEQLGLTFRLTDKSEKSYEIKTSFPTLEKSFWLKLINLRVSIDPPPATIAAVKVTGHFTRPRPSQRGLYAVSRPEPENLLLTVNKLKKLVGDQHVGVPALLDQRLPEAFTLDAQALPLGRECLEVLSPEPVLAFTYFHPPVRADVLVRDHRLIYVSTQYFRGHVLEYSGVWRASSKWWGQPWKTQEWDVEIEGCGIYRLCKAEKEWFLMGEYD